MSTACLTAHPRGSQRGKARVGTVELKKEALIQQVYPLRSCMLDASAPEVEH